MLNLNRLQMSVTHVLCIKDNLLGTKVYKV